MTSGVLNGTDFRLYLGGVAIGRATNCSMEMTAEIRTILDKDSPGAGWQEGSRGVKSATLSTTGFVSMDTANKKVSQIFTLFDAGTVSVCRFTTEETGDTYWEASVIVNSISFGAPVEDNVTYDIGFTVTGAVTQGTES